MDIKVSILNNINTIFEDVSKKGLKKPIEKNFPNELTTLSKYFNTNKIDAFFIVMVFGATLKKSNSIDLTVLTDLLKWPTIKILEYSSTFDNLVKKQYLIKDASKFSNNTGFANYDYMLNAEMTDSIIKNKAMPKLNKNEEKNIVDVFEYIFNISDSYNGNVLSEIHFKRDLDKVLKGNSHFKLFKTLAQHNISNLQQFSFIVIIWKTLVGDKAFTAEDVINKIGISVANKIKYMQNFVDSDVNKLLGLDLIEIDPDEFINDSIVSLSKKALNILEKEDIKIMLTNKIKHYDGVILPKNISKSKLFFDDNEAQQLKMMQTVLMPKKFKELQVRLNNKKLPTGLTAILYGHPGTGKTESVLQLAKKSGRAIMQVDISKTKSKWFGDSEKLIKKIFTDYYKFKAQKKLTPILLFNEADAIISKRKDASLSNISQTENAIQNIILEELEKFDGILLATTNLVNNMDSAFERRFLFKIEFSKPSVSIISKIWKTRVKTLTIKESKLLANKYKFTGGQISNIVRKMEMYEVINGINITIEKIETFCEDELFNKDNRLSIGFNN